MTLRPALFLAAAALGCATRGPADPSPAAVELSRIDLHEESRLAIEDVLFHAQEFGGALERAWQDLKSRQVRLRPMTTRRCGSWPDEAAGGLPAGEGG